MKPGNITHSAGMSFVFGALTCCGFQDHTLILQPHVLEDSPPCVFAKMQQRDSLSLSLCVPPPFCLKSRDPVEENSTPADAEKKAEPLKTKRLKEYTIQSLSSMPQNNTYANFERFARVVEDVGLMEMGVSEVAEAHCTLQGDMEALLSIYTGKEAWYKEESESARKHLSQVRYEFRKVEAQRRQLQEDLQDIEAGLGSISGKYSQRQSQLDSLRLELDSELQWLQEVMSSLHPEGTGGVLSGSLNTDVKQALSELLHHSCRGELHPEARQKLTESG